MRLFISYAHVNRSKVDELERVLEKAGNEVWFDSELIGGDNWWQSILDQIEQCDVFVFALSPQSTGSAACRAEFQYALDLNKPILPILLKEAELPVGKLRETQYVDARKLNSSETALTISRSLLNLQKQVLSGTYIRPESVSRPAFPFEADPLKDVREQVRNLPGASEEDIVRVIFRLKQVGRLSDKSARESRMLLETIMTAPHVPHSVAMEASDALKTLPQVQKRSARNYAIGGIAGIIVIIFAILIINNPIGGGIASVPTSTPTDLPSSTPNPAAIPTETPTSTQTATPTETATPTITFTPSPTERFIPTPANGREVITAENASQVERLEWLGRGRPLRIAWSPDETTVAVSTSSGMVWLYNPDEPDQQLRLLEGHTLPVEGVAFNPDGTILASSSYDKTVRLWDVATGSPIGSPINFVNREESWARSVAFSPDGTQLVVGGCWGLQIFDVSNPELPTEQISLDLSDCVISVAFNPSGTMIAYGGIRRDDQQAVSLLDIAAGSVRELGVHAGFIYTVAFSSDGSLLASGDGEGLIKMWDVTSDELIRTIEGHTRYINSLLFMPDGEQLISASSDATIRIWNVNTGEQEGEPLLGHTDGNVLVAALHPDGQILASTSYDGTLRFWDIAQRTPISDPITLFSTSSGSRVAFSADGSRLAASYDDGTIRLWDELTGSGNLFREHEVGPIHIDFSPANNDLLASGGTDDTVRLYVPTIDDEKSFQLTGVSFGQIFDLAFSPDGARIAVAMTGDDAVRIWDVAANTNIASAVLKTDTPHGDTLSVAFSPDGTYVASGYRDGTVILWDSTNTGREFTGHQGPVWAVGFSPDGKYLISGSHDNSETDVKENKIRIWNIETGEFRELSNDFGDINKLTFSADGKLMAAGTGSPHQIWLWDISDMDNLRPVADPLTLLGGVWGLAFSPDGTLLAANDNTGAVSIWGICDAELDGECTSK